MRGKTLTQKEASENGLDVGIKLIGTYKNNYTKTEFECPFCKKNFFCKPSHVFTKNIKSCGCNRSQALWKGGKYISGRYLNTISNHAKKRNLLFDITTQELEDLLEQQNFKCALSDLPIKCGRSKQKKCSTYEEQTASLDRIDSLKGYVKGNVQWVHKDINRIKTDFNQDYFIEICNRIAKQHPKDI